MEEILNIIANYGIGVACILYFMYFNNTTMKQLIETVNKVNQSLILFNERLEQVEDRTKTIEEKLNTKKR
jgi:hypothetical protein